MTFISSENQECISAFRDFSFENLGQSHFFFVRKQPEKSRDALKVKTMNKSFCFFAMTVNERVKLLDY